MKWIVKQQQINPTSLNCPERWRTSSSGVPQHQSILEILSGNGRTVQTKRMACLKLESRIVKQFRRVCFRGKRDGKVRQMVKVRMDFVSFVKVFGKQWYASLTEKRKMSRTFVLRFSLLRVVWSLMHSSRGCSHFGQVALLRDTHGTDKWSSVYSRADLFSTDFCTF